MHFPVEARHFAIGVDDRGAVVINARRAPFEDGRDDYNLLFLGDLSQRLRAGPRHRFREVKQLRVFPLAEILGAEKLRQADHLRPLLRRLVDTRFRPAQVLLRVRTTHHLDQADGEFSLHGIERTQLRVICQEAEGMANSEW